MIKTPPGMNPTSPMSTLTQLLGKQNPFITPTEALDGSHENTSPEMESSHEIPIPKDSSAPLVGVFRGDSNFPILQSSQPEVIPDHSPIMHKGGRDLSDHSLEDVPPLSHSLKTPNDPHSSNSATSSIPGNGPLSSEISSDASDLLHDGEIPDLDDSKISPTLDNALKQGLNTPTGDTPSLRDLLKNKLNDSKPTGSTIDESLTPQKSSSDPSVNDISSLPSSALVKQLLGKDLPPGSMPNDDQLKELVNKLKSGNLPSSGVPNSSTNDPLNSKLDPTKPHDDYLDALVNQLKAGDPLITPTASSNINGQIPNSNAIKTPTDDYLQGLVNKLKSGSPPAAGQQNSTSNASAIPNSNDVKDPVDKYLEGLVNQLKSEGEPSLNPTSDPMSKPNDVMLQALVDKLKSGDAPLLPSQMPSTRDADGPPSLHDLLQGPILTQNLLSPIPKIDQASPVSKSPEKAVSTDEPTGVKKPSIDLKKLLTSEELPSDLLSEEHDLSPEATATHSSPSSIPPTSSPLFSKPTTQDLNSTPSSEKASLKPLTPLQKMPLSSLSPILMPTDGNPFEVLLSDSAKPSTNTTPNGVNPSTGDLTATPSPLKNANNQPIKSPDGLKPPLSQFPSIMIHLICKCRKVNR
ncbi:hypothetical protein U1Q18_050915 [Sarracenia purpurea var. burkii]